MQNPCQLAPAWSLIRRVPIGLLDAVPLVTYGKGYYRMFDMLLPGAIISVAWIVVLTGLLLLIGPLIGLV